jgi:hypothetical protein
MQLKTRRLLFFASLIMFLIASPTVIMYSLGYKLNLKTFKIQKTGGIFINIDYQDYKVFIDDILKKSVSKPLFTQQGVLIPNLIPKPYNLKISKNGYKSWEKTLKVESGIVTEIKNVFLVPENLSTLELDNDILDFALSNSKENLVYIKDNTLISLNIKNDRKIKIKLPETLNGTVKILKESFNKNIIYLENDDNILKIDIKTQGIILAKKPKSKKYIKILPNPKDSNLLFTISNENILYELDVEKNLKTELTKNVNNFYVTGESIIYTTKDPVNFYKRKIGSEKSTQITFIPIKNISENSKILVRFDDPVVVLNDKKELLLFDYSSEKFKKLTKNITDAKVSNDFSKMIYRNDHEIYVYYFEASYPRKKAGNIDLLGRFSKKIQDASWFDFDNQHIFLTINGKVSILELDGRNKRNFEEMMPRPQKFIYNNYDKSIYFLKDNNLQKLELFLKSN